MRSFSFRTLSVLFLAAPFLPDSALAAPMPFTATLTLQIGATGTSLGVVGQFQDSAVGVADVAPDGSFMLSAALFQISDPCPATGGTCPVVVNPFFDIGAMLSNAAGSFAPTSAGFGGDMSVSGILTYGFLRAVSATFIGATSPVIGVPGTHMAGDGGIFHSVRGDSWTTGVATLAGSEGNGTQAVPFAVSLAGTDARNAQLKGTVQLVTPVMLSTSVTGDTPAFGILTIQFVPEPRGLGLLALAGLRALVGRRVASA